MDATRRRRVSQNLAKRRWYSLYRSARFRRRFGWKQGCTDNEIAEYYSRAFPDRTKTRGSITRSIPPAACV